MGEHPLGFATQQQSRQPLAAMGGHEDQIAAKPGPIHAEILAAAQRHGCDLIFMASHGRKGLGGLLLGSETQRVLTHGALPVLVYREPPSSSPNSPTTSPPPATQQQRD